MGLQEDYIAGRPLDKYYQEKKNMNYLDTLKSMGFEMDDEPVSGENWTHYQYIDKKTGEYLSIVTYWAGRENGNAHWEYRIDGKTVKAGSDDFDFKNLEKYLKKISLNRDVNMDDIRSRKVTINPAEQRDRKYGFVRELRVGPDHSQFVIKLTSDEYRQLIHEIEIDGMEDLNI